MHDQFLEKEFVDDTKSQRMSLNSASNGLKVALIGDSGVGKSTILSILLGDSFSPLYVKTKERVIKYQDVMIDKRNRQKLQIWDTGGDDENRTYAAYSIRDVQGIIIVLDVCDEDSFMHVQNWMKLIKDTIELAESIVIIIAANKIDKAKKRQVQKEQVQQLANQYNVQHIEVSAKSEENIDKLFQMLARELHKRAQEKSAYKTNTDEVDDYAESDEPEKSFFDKCIIL